MNGDEYLERVRKLVPAFRERDALTERTRRLPDESWADFQRAQLLRALQPARWGGFELHPAALYRAVMEVGAACPSTAWVLGVLGVHSWQLAAFPERAQQEVWGADSTVQASSSYAPTGRIERVEGGFKRAGDGRSPADAISATGRFWAARRAIPTARPTRAATCCQGPTTRSMTTGA